MAEKTEQPTPRKLAEARERGQVARSIELNAAMGLMAGAMLLQSAGKGLVEGFGKMFKSSTDLMMLDTITFDWLKENAIFSFSLILPSLMQIVLVLMVVGVGVTIVQTGFSFASKRKFVDFERVNPVKGIKRLFSLDGLQQLIKSMLKLVVVGYVVYAFAKKNLETILVLAAMDISSGINEWVALAFKLIWNVATAYFVLAVADYIFQRWNFMRQMRMSRQEIIDEVKQSEGDPFMRSRIRQLQRQMMARRMMANVPKADVIITNPTHLAIAIKYDAETMRAPKVLAKGSMQVAKRIVEKAKEHQIPVMENKPVARAIYAAVDIDEEIPPEMYMAIAEILAHVYKMRRNKFTASPVMN